MPRPVLDDEQKAELAALFNVEPDQVEDLMSLKPGPEIGGYREMQQAAEAARRRALRAEAGDAGLHLLREWFCEAVKPTPRLTQDDLDMLASSDLASFVNDWTIYRRKSGPEAGRMELVTKAARRADDAAKVMREAFGQAEDHGEILPGAKEILALFDAAGWGLGDRKPGRHERQWQGVVRQWQGVVRSLLRRLGCPAKLADSNADKAPAPLILARLAAYCISGTKITPATAARLLRDEQTDAGGN